MRFRLPLFLMALSAMLLAISFNGDDADASVVLDNDPSDPGVYGQFELAPGSYKVQVDVQAGYDGAIEFVYGEGLSVTLRSGVYTYVHVPATCTCSFVTDPGYIGTLSYDVEGPDSYVVLKTDVYTPEGYTTFQFKAGSFSFSTYVDINTFLVLNDVYFPLYNMGYIPFDCDDAYLYRTNVSNVDDAKAVVELTNTPDEYEHKDLVAFRNGSSLHTEMTLKAGIYDMRFSCKGQLVLDYDSISFSPGVLKNVVISSDVKAYYFASTNIGSRTTGPLFVYYDISPEPDRDMIDDSYDMEQKTSATVYKWYYREFTLGPGQHSFSSNQKAQTSFVKGSEEEAAFISDVIGGHLTEIPIKYRKNVYNLTETTTIRTYILSSDADYGISSNFCYYVDQYNLYYGAGTPVDDPIYERFYVSANTTAKLAVDYDTGKFLFYYSNGYEQVFLPSKEIVEVHTDKSTEFTIVIKPLYNTGEDAFVCEYEMYLTGDVESDGNAVLFAILCIGLCALFFGLLFISGKKPRWKD